MEEVKVCRLCLIMDVKMFDLQSYPLDSYFGAIAGSNLLTIANSPPYACYECAALVKKFYFFKQKCLRSQAILYGLIDLNGKIAASQIKQINRKNQLLCSNLTAFHIDETTQNAQNTFIKREPKVEDTRSNFAVKCVKEEDICDVLSDRCLSSDDDEPLSLHKEKKKREGSVIKEYQDVVVEIEPNETVEELHTPPPKKRKRDRSKKPKDGLGDNVTVINLSFEDQIEEINKRKESSNYLNSPFQCNMCYKGFTDTHAWKHHVAKHSPSAGDIECAICKFRFKTKYDLQKHLFYHKKKYQCKSCSHISSNTTQAKHHQNEHRGVTYECKFCGDVFTGNMKYTRHMRVKHPSSEFICTLCGYSCLSKLGLARHKTIMHKDIMEKGADVPEDGPYCEECDVKFLTTEAFKHHIETSTKHTRNLYSNDCRTCGESFNDETAMKMHHRKEHARQRPKYYRRKPDNQKWPAKCEHCSEVIQSGRERVAHFRRAHPDKKYPVQKNYVCDICGKSFTGNAFLIYHRRTHTEVGTHKCAECGKAFFDQYILKRHMKTHSDHRPFPCTVCFKAFKSKGALDRHFRIHTGQKPYECEICGKAFNQGNSRKLHITTVHFKQPAPYISRRRSKKHKIDKPMSCML